MDVQDKELKYSARHEANSQFEENDKIIEIITNNFKKMLDIHMST